jgi:alkaline phosphatase D
MKRISNQQETISRRAFLLNSAAVTAGVSGWSPAPPLIAETRQATGVKVGEVTSDSAIVWMRLTANSTRNNQGLVIKKHIQRDEHQPITTPVQQLEGTCPGAAGRARVWYSVRPDMLSDKATRWAPVTAETDFTHQFALTGLRPATTYYYAIETASPDGKTRHGVLTGRFETARRPAADAELSFCVLSCQMYAHMDHDEGFNIYPAMQRLRPQFIVFTGDNVYYDNEEPRATSVELARYHWERMYSLPRHIELLRNVASYWEKDDHDLLQDDCWPEMESARMKPLTFAEGQRIYRQQVPMSGKSYRTFRWGRHLQIWLTEGRDFRTPNNGRDGTEKTIWGTEQKAWLKRTLRESDATWKVLISPTPIVGPDRGTKNDNHSNAGFTHEGDEIRQWLKANAADNCFIVCGDRHWQYHSVHPETGLREFSVGAASDQHAGGSPGENPRYHRFHRVKGGFLSVSITRKAGKSAIAFRYHDVNGQTVHQWMSGED